MSRRAKLEDDSDDSDQEFASSSDEDSDYEETLGTGNRGSKSGKGSFVPVKKRTKHRSNSDDDSDGDSDDEEDWEQEFSHKYDIQGFENEADYQALMKMPEFERESILADRLEQRAAAEDMFNKRRKLAQRTRQHKKANYTLDVRKRGAQQFMQGKIEREAEEKKEEEAAREKERLRAERAAERARAAEEAQGPEADADMLRQCQLSRDELEKWENEPFFAEAVEGALVRVSVGENAEGQPVYRLCKIRKIKEMGPSYELVVSKRTTKRRMGCVHGDHHKYFKLTYASNSKATDEEVRKWKSSTAKSTLPDARQWRRVDVDRVVEQLERFRNFEYTDEYLQERVAQNREKGKYSGRVAMDRVRLQAELAEARKENDEEKTEKLVKQLMDLDEMERRQREAESTQSSVAMAKLNERNKKLNAMADLEVARAKKDGTAANPEDDAFARRQTRPRVLWSTSKTRSSSTDSTDAKAASSKKAAEEAKKKEEEANKKAAQSKSKKRGLEALDEDDEDDALDNAHNRKDVELSALHDFELDLDLDDLDAGMDGSSSSSVADGGDGGGLSESKRVLEALTRAKRQRVGQ